jgi:hypothetical protein
MAYTVFEKKFGKELPPAVTITAAGRLGLSAGLTRMFKKNEVESVLLLSDPEKRKIAIQPAASKDKRSYRLAYAPDLSQSSMSAKPFLMMIGWDGKTYPKIPASWDDRNSLLEFAMPKWKSEQEIVPVSRGKKQAS